MKLKNISTKHRQRLERDCAQFSETWCKQPVFHPTVDTYFEAFTRGAKSALNLPPFTLEFISTAVAELSVAGKDSEWTERAWKALMAGDAKIVEDALALTEKVDPPSESTEEEKTPPAASQEATDQDKEDAE